MISNTGEVMQRNFEEIGGSIDKALGYIEQDIENPDRQGDWDDLIDVHTLLTKIKVNHIEKHKTQETKPDDLFVYSFMVVNAFSVIFGEWEADNTITDERVLLYNDLIYIDINRDGGPTQCIVSFYHASNPVIVAESINILKDLFGTGVKVSSEVFMKDEATGNYIWGDEDIQQHLRNINGNRVRPIIYFDDGQVGNA